MKPLKSRKSPVVAAILAFLFGGLGLGLYLRSWRDLAAGISIGLGMSALTVKAGVAGLLIAGLVLAAYAVLRVTRSNAELERRTAPERVTTLTAA
jgi:hypothetical protein